MSFLTTAVQFVMDNIYLRFILVLAVSFLVGYISRFIVKRVLKPLAKKSKTKLDDVILKAVSSMIFYVVMVIGIKIGLQHFRFQTGILNSLVSTLLILFVCILIIRVINNLGRHWLVNWAAKTESTADDRLIPLLEKILKTVVIILSVIFIFDAWNVDISPLLATAGIAGLAISFAVKDSLTNILGGLQLVLDKTFKVGDKIELESNLLGVVLDIGLRSTKLKTYDNEVIYIPNGYLANAKIKNFTVPDLTQRVNIEFGVNYGSDVEKVRRIVLDAVNNLDSVLDQPVAEVHFMKMSDFSLDFIARVWVESYAKAYNSKREATEAIYNALNKAGIGIPFPTRTIYTKSLDK